MKSAKKTKPTRTRTKPAGKTVDTFKPKQNHIVNKEVALTMALQGKPYSEIAARWGVTVQAISKLLKPHRTEIEGYQAFKHDPATVYEFTEFKLISSVDNDDIKKMGGYQKVGSAGLIRDKVRLERNQSTGNYNVIVGALQDLQRLRSASDG